MSRAPSVPEMPQTLSAPLVGKVYEGCGVAPAALDRPTIVRAAAKVAAGLLVSRFGGREYLQQFTAIDLDRYYDDLSDETHGDGESGLKAVKSPALIELSSLQSEELGWRAMRRVRKALRQELALAREDNWKRALACHEDRLVSDWKYLDGQYMLWSTIGHGGSQSARLHLKN